MLTIQTEKLITAHGYKRAIAVETKTGSVAGADKSALPTCFQVDAAIWLKIRFLVQNRVLPRIQDIDGGLLEWQVAMLADLTSIIAFYRGRQPQRTRSHEKATRLASSY